MKPSLILLLLPLAANAMNANSLSRKEEKEAEVMPVQDSASSASSEEHSEPVPEIADQPAAVNYPISMDEAIDAFANDGNGDSIQEEMSTGLMLALNLVLPLLLADFIVYIAQANS
jgi:hypothetical protein